jgi:hypothetical protein
MLNGLMTQHGYFQDSEKVFISYIQLINDLIIDICSYYLSSNFHSFTPSSSGRVFYSFPQVVTIEVRSVLIPYFPLCMWFAPISPADFTYLQVFTYSNLWIIVHFRIIDDYN